MKYNLYCAGFILLVATATMAQEQVLKRNLFTFDHADSLNQWQVVNDGVMGGISESRFQIIEEGVMEFSGHISLENNGGFASMRTIRRPLGLRPGDTIGLRLRGDGRRYYLNLYIPGSRPAFSYRVGVATTPGQWIDVAVPVEQFRATWFGRNVDDSVDVEQVNSLGFMLSDGDAGPFRLSIGAIQVSTPEVRK